MTLIHEFSRIYTDDVEPKVALVDIDDTMVRDSSKLTDPSVASTLRRMDRSGWLIIFITYRMQHTVEDTEKMLERLGINYQHHMLFTNGKPKGTEIDKYFEFSGYPIVAVDDDAYALQSYRAIYPHAILYLYA